MKWENYKNNNIQVKEDYHCKGSKSVCDSHNDNCESNDIKLKVNN